MEAHRDNNASYHIYNKDCLDVLKNIPDNSIDLIVTDPPYGINFISNYRKEKYNSIYNDKSLCWLDDYVE